MPSSSGSSCTHPDALIIGRVMKLLLLALLATVDAASLSVLKLRGGKKAPEPSPFLGLAEGLPATGGAAGIGGIMGFCSGKAAKTAAEGVAVAVGVACGGLALLSKQGYIVINYKKVEYDLVKLLDFNGDGKLDEDDYIGASTKLIQFMNSHGIGSSGGFAMGFAAAIKS